MAGIRIEIELCVRDLLLHDKGIQSRQHDVVLPVHDQPLLVAVTLIRLLASSGEEGHRLFFATPTTLPRSHQCEVTGPPMVPA